MVAATSKPFFDPAGVSFVHSSPPPMTAALGLEVGCRIPALMPETVLDDGRALTDEGAGDASDTGCASIAATLGGSAGVDFGAGFGLGKLGSRALSGVAAEETGADEVVTGRNVGAGFGASSETVLPLRAGLSALEELFQNPGARWVNSRSI